MVYTYIVGNDNCSKVAEVHACQEEDYFQMII